MLTEPLSRLSTEQKLGYAGVLPFVALALLHLIWPQPALMQMFFIYSIAIISFVAGSLWRPNQQSILTASLVVLPTIPLPLGVFVNQSFALLWLAASFAFVLVLQIRLAGWQDYDASYRTMRWWLTTLVCSCHLLMLYPNWG